MDREQMTVGDLREFIDVGTQPTDNRELLWVEVDFGPAVPVVGLRRLGPTSQVVFRLLRHGDRLAR